MAQKNFTTSLIVSTYNWPEALNLCLISIQGQTVLPDEVIIADDGSTDATRNLIEKFQKDFPVPIIHIWHPDEGFQLAKIRNKAIAASTKDYIIQIDGDLILHRRFIEDHIDFSNINAFATGSRVIMDEELSKKLLHHGNTEVNIFAKGISNLSNGIRLKPLANYLADRYRTNDIYYMRGCNMAFWRKHLVTVNGYNEEFVGWGREDNEIAIRLMNSGVSKRVIKFSGIVFHIHHPVKPKDNLDKNDDLLLEAVKTSKQYCEKGVSQYSTSNS